jgi:ADP-ribose pyrophosphatase YjhB (NUDIX family)
MVCPNCEDGIVYFGVRRCGSISATCSCPGGILIDDETLDEAMRRADASATDNASAAKWLQKSQPPEQ